MKDKDYLNIMIISNIIIILVCIISVIRVGYSPYPIIIGSLNVYGLAISIEQKLRK